MSVQMEETVMSNIVDGRIQFATVDGARRRARNTYSSNFGRMRSFQRG